MLSNAHAVLFTCEEEKRLARGTFFDHADYRETVVAFCAANQATSAAPGPDAFRVVHPLLQGRRYLLFVGRIHPKKACDQLITAFATVADLDPGLDFVIAGPDQTGWVPALKAQAETLGIGNRVHWPGMIGGGVKQEAYANALAFVLPSHQENFGIVVAEALSAGTPVLISIKVNIWREIESDGAGLVVPDTVEDTSDMLRRFLTMPAEAASGMRLAARRCHDGHIPCRRRRRICCRCWRRRHTARRGPSDDIAGSRRPARRYIRLKVMLLGQEPRAARSMGNDPDVAGFVDTVPLQPLAPLAAAGIRGESASDSACLCRCKDLASPQSADGRLLGPWPRSCRLLHGPHSHRHHAIVSQRDHLCGGTHDISRSDFQLRTRPTDIGASTWICAEAFVGPGVGDGAVLAARGAAFSGLADWTFYRGNPAMAVKERSRFVQ